MAEVGAEVDFLTGHARANRLAHAFIELGLEPHDRVAWCGPNSIDVLVVMHAARKACVTAVAVNYRLGDDEVAYVLSDSGVSAAWIDAECAEAAQGGRLR